MVRGFRIRDILPELFEDGEEANRDGPDGNENPEAANRNQPNDDDDQANQLGFEELFEEAGEDNQNGQEMDEIPEAANHHQGNDDDDEQENQENPEDIIDGEFLDGAQQPLGVVEEDVVNDLDEEDVDVGKKELDQKKVAELKPLLYRHKENRKRRRRVDHDEEYLPSRKEYYSITEPSSSGRVFRQNRIKDVNVLPEEKSSEVLKLENWNMKEVEFKKKKTSS